VEDIQTTSLTSYDAETGLFLLLLLFILEICTHCITHQAYYVRTAGVTECMRHEYLDGQSWRATRWYNYILDRTTSLRFRTPQKHGLCHTQKKVTSL